MTTKANGALLESASPSPACSDLGTVLLRGYTEAQQGSFLRALVVAESPERVSVA